MQLTSAAIKNPLLAEGETTKLPAITILRGELANPGYHPIPNRLQNRRMLYCHSGSALLVGKDGTLKFLSAGTTALIQPHEQWELLIGRGKQYWILADWERDNPAIPDTNLEGTHCYLISNCSLVVRALTERVANRAEELEEWPNFTLAWFNMLIHEHHVTERSFALTPGFAAGADPIEDLITEIKVNPQKSWNLTDAAKLAGYSPFHLSRVFRAVANMGFPEFVDRCRTELAIEQLLATSDQLNIISDRCGFGTPQAMRNACREYTGFLPSELRYRSGE